MPRFSFAGAWPCISGEDEAGGRAKTKRFYDAPAAQPVAFGRRDATSSGNPRRDVVFHY